MILNKALITSVLIVYCFGQAQAQSDTILLQPVEVSTVRPPDVYSETGRMLSIISREQIQTSTAHSLNDILRQYTGLDVRQRGSNGVQADISIRGGSFEQTLVLLNGIRMNDPQTGHHSMNIPVDLEMIERIEVLHGPAGRVYGAGAFAGAINIVTTADTSSSLRLKISAGEHAFNSISAGLSLSGSQWSNQLIASRSSSNGYIENTDFLSRNIFFRSRIPLFKGELVLQSAYNEKDFGAQAFYTPKYPNQFEALRTHLSSLTFTSGKRIKYTQKLYFRSNSDRFELFRDAPPAWYSGHNFHLSRTGGAEFSLTAQSAFGITSLGIELRSEQVMSNVLGEPLSNPRPVRGSQTGSYTKMAQRDVMAVYAGHVYYTQRLTLSAGAMMQLFRGHKAGFYPGLDAEYQIHSRLRFFAGVNSSLRMPSFTDLYYSGPTNTGNIALLPEEVIAAESGLRFLAKGLSLNASLFHRKGTNIIDWVLLPGQTKWTTLNYTQLNTSGIDFVSNMQPGRLLRFVQNLSVNYTYLMQSKLETQLPSYYVLDYLKHKAGMQLTHSLYRQFAATWSATYYHRNGSYTQLSGDGRKTLQ
jgi:vitamin B12 transporter